MVTFNGSSTAMKRGAVALSSSRMQCSSTAAEVIPSNLVTPTILHIFLIAAAGTPLRRNPLMQRMAEGLFGLKLLIPAHMEEAAYGAALCAMAASGAKPSLKDAQKLIRYEGE